MMRKIERENTGNMKPGQDLVVAGYAGLAGTLFLLEEKRAELERWFSRDYLDTVPPLREYLTERDAQFWERMGATEWEQSDLGGILNSIWTLSGAYETGVEFTLRQIPIRQETIEICERLECNPYRLYSRGCWLLTAVSGNQLTEHLAEEGIPARVIGRINPGIAREIISEEGRGYLERPHKDEILKIIPKFRKLYC
jgi:hydrogenase maturation factor